jgi:hypothetical protein
VDRAKECRAQTIDLIRRRHRVVTFVLPFSLSPRIQDVIGFQWPAFFITSAFVPAPSLYYGQGRPVPLEIRSYLALTAMVGLYWFAIATWLDKRIVQRTHISSLRWVRVLMGIASIPSVALLLGFYSKDVVHGGWPEGPQGAYGFTAWLGFVSGILVVEAGWVRPLRTKVTHMRPDL